MSVFTIPEVLHIPRPGRLSGELRSRLRSPDIGVRTVGEVLSHYGLSLAGSPRNLPNARRNRNLIVETSGGRKVLKHYRRDWSVSTIEYEHSILNRLAELHSPAPRLAVTTKGGTYVQRDGDNYAVFEFIPGETYSMSFLLRSHRLTLMATAGETLARLHLQIKGFLPQGQHHLGFKSYYGGRRRDIAWHVAKVAELKARSRQLGDPGARLQAGWLVDHADEILETLTRLDESLGRALLPRVIIHGDYGLHNLIFQEPRRATPVDFELARLEWRLSDLVSAISKFRYGQGSYDFESIIQFMHAYQREYPIADEEWRHFPAVWRHYKLAKAVQYWSSYFETGGPTRKLVSARDEVGHAVWALQNPQRLVQLMARS
jgi:Ser/Thr protein kinase RdoA (MazF antagonist)